MAILRIRRWLYAIFTGFFLVGLSIGSWYGWSYAKQTIWLGHEHLTVYQPVESSAVRHTHVSPTEQSHATNAAIQPTSQDKHLHVTMVASPVKLWTPVPKDGTKIGTLSIPSIHLTVPVVQGTSDGDLALGAGHERATAFPGQGSNVLIAGHRDTVFSPVRFLKKGAKLQLVTPYGTFVYQAVGFQIVAKTDVAVMAPTPFETLTLSTCYPFFYVGHAPKRYIVYTRLVSEPKLR